VATIATEKELDNKGQKAEEQRANVKKQSQILTFHMALPFFKSLQYQCLDFRSPQKHSAFGSQDLV